MKAHLKYWAITLAFAVAAMVGCGKSEGPAPGNQTPQQAPAQQQPQKTGNNANKTPRPGGDGPDVAVYDFMEAVRVGDDETAGKLLTPLARQKVAEHHMVVAPPGTDTARFQVGRVEPTDSGVTKVAVNWTDLDDSGKQRTDEIIWLAKKADEGWRISGVAAPVFDGEAPILLNFEDPAEMLRKQQAVREEMRRRAQQQAGAGVPPAGQAPAQASQAGPAVEQAARPAAETRR
jgi:hypothetical protein